MAKQLRGMRNFRWLSGDVNWREYGGIWYRRIEPGWYEVIEFWNWEDLVGSDAPAKYGAARCEVGWQSNWHAPIKEALAYRGMYASEEGIVDSGGIVMARKSDALRYELVLLEALFSYGHKEVIEQVDGNNYRQVLRAVR